MRKNKMNRLIAFTAVIAMLFSVSVSAMPEDDSHEDDALVWHTVHLKKGAFAREMLGPQGRALFCVDGGPGAATRSVYLSFDLADYLNGSFGDIAVEELRLKLNVTERPFSGIVGVYVLPKALSDFDPASLDGPLVNTVNPKTGTSMINDESNFAVGIPHGPNEPTLTGDLWPAVKKYFDENPGTTSFTLRLSEMKSPAPDSRVAMVFTGATANNNEPILRIGFKTEEIKRVEDAMREIVLGKISSEDGKNVTKNLHLPATAGNGVKVKWISSDAETINPVTGSVTRPSFGERDREVTLTAEFAYGAYVRKADYAVTVLAKRSDPAYSQNTLPVLEGAYVSGANPKTVMDNKQLIADDGREDRRVSFLKFDISSCKNRLNELDSIMLRLIPYNGGGRNQKVTVYMFGDTAWNERTLTYSNAASLMKLPSNSVNTFAGRFDESGVLYSGDILPAVKQYFSNNPSAKGIVTFKIDCGDESFSFHGAAAQSEDLRPSVIVESYEDALKETIKYLTPDKIYEGPIGKVRGNLNLFAQWKYSAKIEWSSSNSAVITPAGAVNRQVEDTDVILTATVTSGGRVGKTDIPVTVLGTGSDRAYFQTLLDGIVFDRTVMTGDFSLPVKLEQMTVVWTTEDSGIAEVDGGEVKVTRPKNGDRSVKITAAISDAGVAVSRDFYFTVIRHPGNDLFMKKAVLNESGDRKNAIDDDMDSVWTLDADKTITVDAGNSKVFGEFLLAYDGLAVSGLQIQSSHDSLVWSDIYIGGDMRPDTVVYATLVTPMYARYVRFVFPSGVNGVRFLGGYSTASVSEQNRSILEKLTLPEEADGNFPLPSEVEGYAVSWTSGDPSVIQVAGDTAIIERQLMDRTVDMIAAIAIDQKPCSIAFPVVVQKRSPFGNTAVWAKEYMLSLWNRGIISELNPNNYLKREEMAKMLTLGFSLGSDHNDVPFSDVQRGDWYYESVSAMYHNGLTNGVGDGMFGVGLNISRQDAALQLARVLESKGITAENAPIESFSDDWQIADYAKNSVYALQALGIISGGENASFNADAYITRAEISKMIFIALKLLN